MTLSPFSSTLRRPTLWLIALAIVASGALLIGLTALVSYQQALDEMELQGEDLMERFRASLERELSKYEYLPELLASDPRLEALLARPDNPEEVQRINRQLAHFNDVAEASVIYLMDTQGNTLASSNWQQSDSFVGKNFNYRPYFTQAMEGRTGRYFALGTTSKIRGYFFAYPLKRDGRIIGVLVLKVAVSQLETLWHSEQSSTVLVDKDGVIFISTRPEWQLKTLRPLTGSDRLRIQESLRYGEDELRSLSMIEQRQLNPGTSLVTLLEPGKPAAAGAPASLQSVDYLRQTQPVPDYGFTLMNFTRLGGVYRQVISHTVLVSTLFVIALMIAGVLMLRRRLYKERAAFRQQTSQTRQLNEARIQAIIDNTHAGLVTLNPAGEILSFNPTAERLFGYQWQQVRGKHVDFLFDPAYRERCRRQIANLMTEQPETFVTSTVQEMQGRRQDGSLFPLEWIIGDMHLSDQRQLLLTLHDITERKRYEHALHQAREQLEHRVEERTRDLTLANERLTHEMDEHQHTQNELIQTAKLALLGQMSAGINHELNQPLAAIRSYSDNARAFLARGDEAKTRGNLDTIVQLTDRMSRLVAQFKVFARKSSGQPEPLQWRQVLDGALAILGPTLEKQQAVIEIDEDAASTWVLGDMLQLEQVLINILTNALQAMSTAEPQPLVRIEIYSGQPDVATEASASGTDMHCLMIRDHGPGIDQAHLQRLFEPFFTTKPTGQGLGIGLSISHRIIEHLGGILDAGNHPEGGAIFRIVLPKASPVKRGPMIG
ncbi:PAS domain S-box protein [Pokkaliibacter sp. CJK22405]|uniref:PAS domain S-box protein n=1 Tax=Pokkaliibacter sp. CJK22405 TaxID=3384615 RepID=UPI003984D383